MDFDLSVEVVEPFVKVTLVELNNQGNPRDGREWYTNLPLPVVLNGEVELDESVMIKALADLMAQRDNTIAQLEAEGVLLKAITDWFVEKLPE